MAEEGVRGKDVAKKRKINKQRLRKHLTLTNNSPFCLGVPNNDSVTLEQVSSPPGVELHPAEAHGSGLARMRRTQCGSQGVKQLRYSCTALNHGWQRDNIPATLPLLLCQGQRPLEDGHGNARTQINNNRYI